MDKEWIEETIREENRRAKAVLRSLTFSPDRPSPEELAAKVIAQAHEQELRNDQLAIMPCGHHASNVVGADAGTAYCKMCELEGLNEKLRVQVATLKGQQNERLLQVIAVSQAAEPVLEMLQPITELMPGNTTLIDRYDRLVTALQSAPKVLWRGRMEVEHQLNPPDAPHTGLRNNAIDDPAYHDCLCEGHEWQRGQEVDVLILEGPNALQEQSKAEEPDSECLPKGKQGQNSEQPEGGEG